MVIWIDKCVISVRRVGGKMAPVTWDPNDLTPFFDKENEFSWEDKVRWTERVLLLLRVFPKPFFGFINWPAANMLAIGLLTIHEGEIEEAWRQSTATTVCGMVVYAWQQNVLDDLWRVVHASAANYGAYLLAHWRVGAWDNRILLLKITH